MEGLEFCSDAEIHAPDDSCSSMSDDSWEPTEDSSMVGCVLECAAGPQDEGSTLSVAMEGLEVLGDSHERHVTQDEVV